MMSISQALAKIERLRIDRDNLEGLYRTGLERRKAEDQRHLDELERVAAGFRAEIGRLEALVSELRLEVRGLQALAAEDAEAKRQLRAELDRLRRWQMEAIG